MMEMTRKERVTDRKVLKMEFGNREQAKIVYNAMNDETGEIDRVPRTVLISPDGTSYRAPSKRIFNSIKNAYLTLKFFHFSE